MRVPRSELNWESVTQYSYLLAICIAQQMRSRWRLSTQYIVYTIHYTYTLNSILFLFEFEPHNQLES